MNRERYRMISWSELVLYDESSPSCLRWKIDISNKVRTGSAAGYKTKKCWDIVYKGKKYKCHVVIYLLHRGLSNGYIVGRRDRDGHNNRIDNLREIVKSMNARNSKRSKANKTGKTGVRYEDVKTVVVPAAYIAFWKNSEGVEKSKRFSVDKYGKDKAFQMACEYRDKAICDRNYEGAGYTPEHGE